MRRLLAVPVLLFLTCAHVEQDGLSPPPAGIVPTIQLDKSLDAGAVDSIQVLLSGDCFDSTELVPVDHNRSAHTFSCVLDIPPSCRICTVTVCLYDTLGRLVGIGGASFGSLASQVTIPVISAVSACPVVDSLVAVPDSVLVGQQCSLYAAAHDSFGGVIVQYEWDIGRAGFVPPGSADTTITAPTDTTHLVCRVRVTDDEGNQTVASVTVPVYDTTTCDTGYLAVLSTVDTLGHIDFVGLPTKHVYPSVDIDAASTIYPARGSLFILEDIRHARSLIRLDPPFDTAATIRYRVPLSDSGTLRAITMADTGPAYVTRSGTSHLLAVDPDDGAVIDSADLTVLEYEYYDLDSSLMVMPPQMTGAVIHGDRVFVLCQRRSGMQGTAPSCVAVVQTGTLTLLDTIPMEDACPDYADTIDGKILVSSSGCTPFSSSGGIDVIGMASMEYLGELTTQSELGGSVGDLAVVDNTRAYAYVFYVDDISHTLTGEIVRFDPISGAIGLRLPSFSQAQSLTYDGSFLYVGNKGDTLNTIVTVDPESDTPIGVPVVIAGAPIQVVYLKP